MNVITIVLNTMVILIVTYIFKVKSDHILIKDELSDSSDIIEDQMEIKTLMQNNLTTISDTEISITPDPTTYCQKFHTCIDCVKSVEYKCGWCHNFGCTHKPVLLCPKTNEYAEKSFTNETCPRILYEQSEGILVPSGVRINLKVKIHASDPVIFDKEIICQVKFKDRLTHLRGMILGEVVYCYPIILNNQFKEVYEGSFQLIWGGVDPFSNEIPITVYQCEVMGTNCDSCMKIRKEYGCGWCDKTEKCVIADKCSDDYMRWSLNRIMCGNYKRKLYYV